MFTTDLLLVSIYLYASLPSLTLSFSLSPLWSKHCLGCLSVARIYRHCCKVRVCDPLMDPLSENTFSTVVLIHVDLYGSKVGTPMENSDEGLVSHPTYNTPSKA